LIAVVDDDLRVRRAVERLLRSAGMETRVFASGGEFLAALPDFKPACVVLDLHMPGQSGFSVLADLQRHVPVVVITGHDSPEAQEQALAGGATAYLCKPVDRGTLLAAIYAAQQATICLFSNSTPINQHP
jgi:FixJ family two-component response regulator